MIKRHLGKISDQGVSHNPDILKRVLVAKGELPHVLQIARTTFEPGQIADVHVHQDAHEYFLCEAGKGSAVVNKEKVQISPGTFLIMEPGDQHEIINSGNEQLIFTTILVED